MSILKRFFATPYSAIIVSQLQRCSLLILLITLKKLAERHTNLSVLGPNGFVLGSRHGTWAKPGRVQDANELSSFWDNEKSHFTLGDFKALGEFLGGMTGVWHLRQPLPGAAAKPADSL